MIVHTQSDQLLPQLLMDQLCNTGTLDICMKKFDAEKIFIDKIAAL